MSTYLNPENIAGRIIRAAEIGFEGYCLTPSEVEALAPLLAAALPKEEAPACCADRPERMTDEQAAAWGEHDRIHHARQGGAA